MPSHFVFMADCQLGCYASFSGLSHEETARLRERGLVVSPTPATVGFSWDLARLDSAVHQNKDQDPDFVIVGGDIVDDPSDRAQFEAAMLAFEQLTAPVHWVPGNHDAADDTVVPSTSSLVAYRHRLGDDYYVFQHDTTAFVIINTVTLGHRDAVRDEFDRHVNWLRETFKALARADVDQTLVFGHHPLFVANPEETDTYWNLPLDVRAPLIDLLTSNRVEAYFCGHLHRNVRSHVDGLEVIITAASGFPLGTDPSGFRVVDIAHGAMDHRYVTLQDVHARPTL